MRGMGELRKAGLRDVWGGVGEWRVWVGVEHILFVNHFVGSRDLSLLLVDEIKSSLISDNILRDFS